MFTIYGDIESGNDGLLQQYQATSNEPLSQHLFQLCHRLAQLIEFKHRRVPSVPRPSGEQPLGERYGPFSMHEMGAALDEPSDREQSERKGRAVRKAETQKAIADFQGVMSSSQGSDFFKGIQERKQQQDASAARDVIESHSKQEGEKYYKQRRKDDDDHATLQEMIRLGVLCENIKEALSKLNPNSRKYRELYTEYDKTKTAYDTITQNNLHLFGNALEVIYNTAGVDNGEHKKYKLHDEPALPHVRLPANAEEEEDSPVGSIEDFSFVHTPPSRDEEVEPTTKKSKSRKKGGTKKYKNKRDKTKRKKVRSYKR